MKEMDSKSLPWVTPVAVGTDGADTPQPVPLEGGKPAVVSELDVSRQFDQLPL